MSERKTRLILWRDARLDFNASGLSFEGFLSDEDYPELDNFDRMLLRDCEKPDATMADKLLALECLFRRAAEQQTERTPPAQSGEGG